MVNLRATQNFGVKTIEETYIGMDIKKLLETVLLN
jgi:hypothetical protein